MSNPPAKIHLSASKENFPASHKLLQSHQPKVILQNLLLLMTYFVCDLCIMQTNYDF